MYRYVTLKQTFSKPHCRRQFEISNRKKKFSTKLLILMKEGFNQRNAMTLPLLINFFYGSVFFMYSCIKTRKYSFLNNHIKRYSFISMFLQIMRHCIIEIIYYSSQSEKFPTYLYLLEMTINLCLFAKDFLKLFYIMDKHIYE
jgi:hypothetical protein